MAIQVTCPGCHKRFNVSDKFAGKKGPCPKCKTEISVPEKTEEVVVHAPEQHGPKDASGRAVLKPISRTETKINPVMGMGIGAGVVVVFFAALLLRRPDGDVSRVILSLGAILLGPPIALGGYAFLRDDELEPYRGKGLIIRATICGLIYAALWGVFAGVTSYLFGTDALEVFQLIFVVPPFLALGAVAAFACLDLDFGSSVVHYGLYLLVTILLCLIMGVKLL